MPLQSQGHRDGMKSTGLTPRGGPGLTMAQVPVQAQEEGLQLVALPGSQGGDTSRAGLMLSNQQRIEV